VVHVVGVHLRLVNVAAQDSHVREPVALVAIHFIARKAAVEHDAILELKRCRPVAAGGRLVGACLDPQLIARFSAGEGILKVAGFFSPTGTITGSIQTLPVV